MPLAFGIHTQPGPNGRAAGQILPFYDERVVALYGAFERGLYAELA